MDFIRTLGGNIPRSGRHDRVNNDRYFHVMGRGWYALTREGIGGPFVEKHEAERFVARVISGEIRPDNQDADHAIE